VLINIAKDFSTTPGGRLRRSGKYSAEEFREKLLLPTLRVADLVIVELDGVCGYAGSFLEEVFGGAARAIGPIIKEKLIIEADVFASRKEEIEHDINSSLEWWAEQQEKQ